MGFKIDNELKNELVNNNKIILNRILKDINDYPETITITPDETKGYYHLNRNNPRNEMIEEYTKRAVVIEGINILLKDVNLDKYDISIEKNIKYSENSNFESFTNVYIIQSVIGGPIKIGKSYDVEERLKQIQYMSPFKLVIIKTFENVSNSFEGYLHDKYAIERLHGEWFDEIILEDILNEK